MCLDRQILFEKEIQPLARCFGTLKVKVLQRFCALDFAESQDSSSGFAVFSFLNCLGVRKFGTEVTVPQRFHDERKCVDYRRR